MFVVGDKVGWDISNGKATGEVAQIVESGFVPDIAAKIAGPAARVRVYREGVATDDFVGVPLPKLDRIAANASMRRSYQIHKPDEAELEKINSMLPSGANPRNSENTIIVPFVAADNLVNRSLDRWDLDSLQKMADLFPGLPMLLDHDWSDVGKVWGKIFESTYEHFSSAPRDSINAANNGKLNRQVVKDEGFGQVVAKAFSSPMNPVVQAIQNGFIGKVSSGGFEFKDYHCPLCKTSFRDESCPHYPPDKYWGITADNDPDVAPYAIRVGLSDMGELSVVTIPNLPNAGVI